MNTLTRSLIKPQMPWLVKPLISLLERITVGTLHLVTPDGITLEIGDGCEPKTELKIYDWSALRRIFCNGDIALAECLRDGLISCSDLTSLIKLGIRNQSLLQYAVHGHPLLQMTHRLRHLLRANTRRGSRRNIQAHYDLGNAFYQLWLDPTMSYSSACFEGDLSGDLEQAQLNKYQRMLDLSGAKNDNTILEIGCGWGGFAEHATTQGNRVHGITLSTEQLHYAQQRIAQAGLESEATLSLCDYRDIDQTYDHIVSIEMLEAVGESYWQTYFKKIHSLLNPGGCAAIQVITIDEEHFDAYRKGTDFIQQYIFPGGMLPSKQKLRELTESSDLTFGQMDTFGADYAETLRRWRERFEQNLEAIRTTGFDEQFIRTWRLYLSYCEAAFDEGRIDLVQLQVIRR